MSDPLYQNGSSVRALAFALLEVLVRKNNLHTAH